MKRVFAVAAIAAGSWSFALFVAHAADKGGYADLLRDRARDQQGDGDGARAAGASAAPFGVKARVRVICRD